jgi:recombination protein RecT
MARQTATQQARTTTKPAPQPDNGSAVNVPPIGNEMLSPMGRFRQELEQMAPQFARALPSHVTVERFSRNLETAVQENPDLLECDRRSLMKSAMTAAQLGLMVGSTLGQAYIVPFREKGKQAKTATLIPGYRGYITLARNSGEVESLAAYEVCAGDEFEYELGLNPRLVHRPALRNRGDIERFYCVAKFKDGGFHVEVMSYEEVEAIRQRSKAPNSPAWTNDFMMMGRKTVIRRAAKYLPLSVQRLAALDAAIEMEGRAGHIDNTGAVVIDHEPKPKGERNRGDAQRLDALEKSVTGGDDKDEADVREGDKTPPETDGEDASDAFPAGDVTEDADVSQDTPEPAEEPKPLTKKERVAWQSKANTIIAALEDAKTNAAFNDVLETHAAEIDAMREICPDEHQRVDQTLSNRLFDLS